jgi:rod shape determining protein RodA
MAVSLRTQRWDWGLFLAAVGLVIVSSAAMVSAAATLNPRLAVRHTLWIAVGILGSIGVARINYRQWSAAVWPAYALSLLALGLVLAAGAVRLGATRWLSILGVSFQPSELAKLTTVLLLARYLAGQPVPLPGRVLWISAALAGPPALLVFIQPDLGSASVFGAIWLGMIWMAGASRRVLAALAAGAMVLAPAGWHLLHGYQRDRLMAFIDPHADPLGAGYTIIQSTIAIGAGRLWGRGWFAGTQNQLNFLPERHSDFIFSVIGEEWGWIGCIAVVVLFGWLLLRASRIALTVSDPYGQLVAGGVCAWIGYQAVINMGMVMGLLPVVGVPLPLVSYGGSSMVILWMALGLLQSVARSDAL